MNLSTTVGVFTLLAALLPTAVLADEEIDDSMYFAEEDELIDEFAMLAEDAMVELAARHKQEIGMSPSAITVITREDIEASGATTIPDLLRLIPGMDVVIASRFFTSISARLYWTFENNLYLVLVDGREANIELIGQAPWEFQPISLQDIQRIEVIRGPGSSLYGANAVAGVVSITTRAVPEKTAGYVHLLGGQYGTMIAAAQASTRLGGFGLSISGGTDLARKFVDPAKLAKNVLKFRAVGEYRRSELNRLLLDLGLSSGSGPFSTSIGTLDSDNTLKTLRLAYDSENFRGQLYWTQTTTKVALDAPLEYGGARLANLVPATINGHTIDAEIQWTLPTFWKPLLVITGGGGRVSYLRSDEMLNGETYADISSPDYHKLGISHWEFRASGFVHFELTPADWVTATLGARFDYNTVTDVFFSPRLATVFRPASGQFIRLGVARAFRKPAWLETHAHLQAHCPPGSPLAGPACDNFQEFMSRVVGNDQLGNEKLTAFELGYLGQYLANRLSVAVDLYFNHYADAIEAVSDITTDEQGLPDLNTSSLKYQHVADWDVFGSEVTVRWNLSEQASLILSWSHRQMFDHNSGDWIDKVPKNMFTLGGRFGTGKGLVGSLYLFSRSELLDTAVENPLGLLEPLLSERLENILLVMGKLGWRWNSPPGFHLEAGCQLSLPVSPFESPHFRYFERGGGFTPEGTHFGGDQLRQMVSVYLLGSF
jgi:outer membrane receptor for ferrienterochelin and colicin